jgi:hypothetical protein
MSEFELRVFYEDDYDAYSNVIHVMAFLIILFEIVSFWYKFTRKLNEHIYIYTHK